MHLVLLMSLLISLLWGLFFAVPFLTGRYEWPLPAALLCVLFLSVFWGVATVYVIDLLNSHYRKNNDFLRKFYAELHTDLLIILVFAGVLFVIFYLAAVDYRLSNIDIACLGIPLFICAIDSLAKVKDRAGLIRFSLGARLSIMLTPVALLILSIWMLVQIYSGLVPASVSLWLQLNILAAGFSAYVGAKQFCYFVKHRRLGISPTLMNMFLKLRGGRPGEYDQIAEMAAEFEGKVRTATAQAAAERRKRKKLSRKRK